MDDETRTARQKALAEKKRRLEEMKARRSAASAPAASTAPASGGNLDDYIDELLKTSAPVVAAVEKVEETSEEKPAAESEVVAVVESAPLSAAAEPQTVAAAAPTPQVEKFEVAIQCEEDDFPPPSLVDEDETKDEPDDEDANQSNDEPPPSRDSQDAQAQTPAELTQEERSKLIATSNFTHFISTASKRVERLLGASTAEEGLFGSLARGNWAGVDYVEDYQEEIADAANKKKRSEQHPYQSGGFFTAKATYEFVDWTKGRNITDIEWCPSHPEWVLTSYNSRSGERAHYGANNPSTRHLSPHDPSSSFLSAPSSSSISNEGIVAIYNLILPTRPEHIFCAGCPIVRTKFHPSEHPKLVLGGGTSGQLLVWDARVGRYPVQRSGVGHDVELVGMDVLTDDGAGSKLVTASSDGKINYWSVSNMREPLESFKVDANLSCMDVLHGSNNEGIVCGDERGGMHAVYSTAASAGAGSSNLKRVVRTFNTSGNGIDNSAMLDEDPNAMDSEDNIGTGHFGMVTSVAVRPSVNNSNTPRSSTSGGTFKGFLQGAGGLVVTTGVDWSTKLWAPAYSDKPLMSFLSNSYDYMCDVQWNPVHPSIFATASSNGTLNLWNLATSLDQPISGSDGIQIADNAPTTSIDSTFVPADNQGLNRLKWSADGRRLAVASGDQLHVLGVGDDLLKSKGDEQGKIMSNLMSRGLISGDVE